MSNSLRPHRLQHTRLPCPSPSPWVCSNSCLLSGWCHPTISGHCHPLLFLPSIFPSIRVFSNESALHIKWPKYWTFSFSISISPSNEYLGLIFFRIDWFDLLAVQRTLKESSPAPQFKRISSSVLTLLNGPNLSLVHDYWKTHSFDYMDLIGKVVSLLLNTPSMFVIGFLPRSKHLFTLWLQHLQWFWCPRR